MNPAAAAMQQALASVTVSVAVVRVVDDVLAAPVTDPNRTRALLVQQVTGSVRWRETVL